MKYLKKDDIGYWIVLTVLIVVLYFGFSDGEFSVIFTLTGTVQTFGFVLIVLKIRKSRSVTGLSRETFICYTIIFSIRTVLFFLYKVLFYTLRDICHMTRLGTLCLKSKRLLLQHWLSTFFTAFRCRSERAIIETWTV